MRQCTDTDKALIRLKKIEGQIRGIINMVQETEKEVSCNDILIQIGAVKSALHKVGKIILEGHLRHCVVDGIKAGDEEETMKKLAVALEQFSRV